MPKKFATENTKSVAARERKKSVKDAEEIRKAELENDEYWKEGDGKTLKRQHKKEQRDQRKQETIQRKAEAKKILDEETANLSSKISKESPIPKKVTRAQIKANQSTSKEKIVERDDAVIEENMNRLKCDGDEARTVKDAIVILSNSSEEVDKHPEKRMKAAYAAFEERRLKEMKQEMPTLKLSQLKQMIHKEWQKSSENPMRK